MTRDERFVARAKAEQAALHGKTHLEPCTLEAFREGCTCHMPSAHTAQIDPPEPKIDKYCPLHGWAADPDEE